MAEIIVDLNKIETEDELLVRLYPAKGEKGEQGQKGADGAKGDKGETGDSGGSAVVVDAVADMSDTTQAYLYVGNESGYTKGDWYYYDGTAWVSGGKYGADGGVNTNARNILKYILEKVAYTEQGMQTYVDALYQALAQGGGGGGGTTTYMIINALTHVTNSNDATGADGGDSYSGTLTVDNGYFMGTVTITMGGTDITSTAYNSTTHVITIASVTGNIVITAVATSALLRNWDLTDSLTDTVNGSVATTTATQGATGLVFNALAQYCDFGAVYQANRTYELDVAEITTKVDGSANRRVLMADIDTDTAYGGGSGLILQNSYWKIYSGSAWININNSTFSGIDYLNGKTLRMYVDANMIWHLYAKTTGSDNAFTLIGESASAMRTYTNGHVYIGGSREDAMANARFTAFRVYEGDIR